MYDSWIEIGTMAFCLTLTASIAGCADPPEASDTAVVAEELVRCHPVEQRVRRNIKDLSYMERHRYVQAVLKLKKTQSPYSPCISYYDQFVQWHVDLFLCDPATMDTMMMAHGGPPFLPWHREFLLLFEDALRQVSGKKITVPYWDWTDPESTAAVFQDNFMGGDGDPAAGYAVTTGPFGGWMWPINVSSIGLPFTHDKLSRQIGAGLFTLLPTAADVQAALMRPFYDVAPFNATSDTNTSFRNFLEGYLNVPPPGMVCDNGVLAPTLGPDSLPILHNLVHGWVGGILPPEPAHPFVGGTMLGSASPNDPVFFLHHANIDRIWNEWQETHGKHSYLPVTGYGENNAHSMMMPYHSIGLMVTPDSVADINALGYRYE
jgi:tyrosinase